MLFYSFLIFFHCFCFGYCVEGYEIFFNKPLWEISEFDGIETELQYASYYHNVHTIDDDTFTLYDDYTTMNSIPYNETFEEYSKSPGIKSTSEDHSFGVYSAVFKYDIVDYERGWIDLQVGDDGDISHVFRFLIYQDGVFFKLYDDKNEDHDGDPSTNNTAQITETFVFDTPASPTEVFVLTLDWKDKGTFSCSINDHLIYASSYDFTDTFLLKENSNETRSFSYRMLYRYEGGNTNEEYIQKMKASHVYLYSLTYLPYSKVDDHNEDDSSFEFLAFAVIGGTGGGVLILLILLCCCCFFAIVIFLLLFVAGGFLFMKKGSSKNNGKRKRELHMFQDEVLLENDQSSFSSFHHFDFKKHKHLFNIQYEDLELIRTLGSGAGGIVYLCRWNGAEVAYKQIHLNADIDEDKFVDFTKEIIFLEGLQHPNIIKMFGAVLRIPRCGFVMEFCPNGDLSHWISTRWPEETNKGNSHLKERLRICEEMCLGMCFLHSKSISHRDFKPDNVLIDSGVHPKLMDFGLSRSIKSVSVSKTKGVGTSAYMAPEIVRGEDYDEKVDQFSFSICLYQVFALKKNAYEDVFEKGKGDFVEYKVANNPNIRPNVKSVLLSKWMISLLENLWDHEPERRMSFEEVKNIFQKERKKLEAEQSKTKTIYMKKNEEEEEKEEEEDVELKESTFNGLMKVCEEFYQKKKIGKIFVIRKGKTYPIKNDDDVLMIDDDSFIDVEL